MTVESDEGTADGIATGSGKTVDGVETGSGKTDRDGTTTGESTASGGKLDRLLLGVGLAWVCLGLGGLTWALYRGDLTHTGVWMVVLAFAGYFFLVTDPTGRLSG